MGVAATLPELSEWTLHTYGLEHEQRRSAVFRYVLIK